MDFLIVHDHEDDLLLVHDAEPRLGVGMLDLCEALQLLHHMLVLLRDGGGDPDLDSALLELLERREEALDFPHEALGSRHQCHGFLGVPDGQLEMIVEIVPSPQAAGKVSGLDQLHALGVEGVQLVDDIRVPEIGQALDVFLRLLLDVLLDPLEDLLGRDGDVLDGLAQLHHHKTLLLQRLKNVVAPAPRHVGDVRQLSCRRDATAQQRSPDLHFIEVQVEEPPQL